MYLGQIIDVTTRNTIKLTLLFYVFASTIRILNATQQLFLEMWQIL